MRVVLGGKVGKQIKIDYDAMAKVGFSFVAEVNNLEAENAQLDSFIQSELRSNWKGVAANEFFAKWDLIREILQKLHKALESGQENCSKIMQIFHDAEEKAKGQLKK